MGRLWCNHGMRWLGLKHVLWVSIMVGVTAGLWTLLTVSEPEGVNAGRTRLPRTKAELVEFLSQRPGTGDQWYQLGFFHKRDGEPALARVAYGEAESRFVDDMTRPATSAQDGVADYVAARWHHIGWCRVELGRVEESREAFLEAAEILEMSIRLQSRLQPRSLYNLACYSSMAGEREMAIAAFERALDAGWRDHKHATEDDDLHPIRNDPRFQRLMDRINPETSPGGRDGVWGG